MQKWTKKFNMGLALVMLVMIISGFFAFPKHPQKRQQTETHRSNSLLQRDSNFWKSLPKRAVAYKKMTVYSDVNLTKKVGEISPKTQLNLTKLSKKAFQLANGHYLSASKKLVISDVPLSRKNEKLTVYSHQKLQVLYNPLTTYDKQVLTTLSGSQALTADKVAKTYWGTYYEILLKNGQKGWVSSQNITLEDPKLKQVEALLQQKYNNENDSIYVKELDSKFTVGVNQNKKIYSASLSKIPILYWVQKRLNEGQITLNDSLFYSASVNGWYGSFLPAGTGSLPKAADNKNYSLQEVINRTAKESDNVGSNLLSYYETQKFSQAYQKTINRLAGSTWNPEQRQASAQMVGKMLEALYGEGGYCFNALFSTKFDTIKIKAGLPSSIPVAHKIGDADRYNHDAAIVFAPVPYVLVVETNGASNQQIQQISHDVYEVLK